MVVEIMEFATDCKEWEFTQENIDNKDFTLVQIFDNYSKESIPLSYKRKFFVATPFKQKETEDFPINAENLINIFMDYYFPEKTVNHDSLRHGSDGSDIDVSYYTRTYVEKCRKFFDYHRPRCYGIKDFYSLGD